MRPSRPLALGLLLSCLALQPAAAADPLVALEVDLGDISLNKVAYLIAGDNGIYAKNGLEVRQYITPAAAETARRSGVIVPLQYVKSDIGNAPIALGSGTPMMYRVATHPRA